MAIIELELDSYFSYEIQYKLLIYSSAIIIILIETFKKFRFAKATTYSIRGIGIDYIKKFLLKTRFLARCDFHFCNFAINLLLC